MQPNSFRAGSSGAEAEARYRQASTFLGRGQRIEAEAALRAALELKPDHAGATHLLGVVLVQLERWPEALAWMRKAAALDRDRANVQRDLGDVLLVMGEVEQAREAFVRALELGPWSLALHNVVTLIAMGGNGDDVSRLWRKLTELQARTDLTTEERILLGFSLGKAHADRGEVALASRAWAEGCRLKRASMQGSIDSTLVRWREIQEAFDRSVVARLQGAGALSSRPVFVCGLPRSGTTLVEQVLSAHPQVFAGGELAALPRVVGAARSPDGKPWPHWIRSMEPGDCSRLAQAYLDQLPKAEPGQTRITDKRLENVEALGLIHVCFPNGALIHVRRDPRDVAFSCWTTLFGWGQMYTYDIEELAAYINAHERLMNHWRDVLPPGRLLEVPYEQLVTDPEGWSRKIVAHCGLDWDDRCLQPHKSSRPVTTISLAQVRKPIKADAVGRWRPYAQVLQALFDRLPEGLL